ncbi:unnamed protein product [Protopolystoma xenopodis]|uniref:Uncharacterized protein n=1 Tax=Protopolystoma xenopodis TaxID=117903 RepID=A0A448WQL5_9PLAT|nr:unnamed protein product [Protopolystoma xenopodis]
MIFGTYRAIRVLGGLLTHTGLTERRLLKSPAQNGTRQGPGATLWQFTSHFSNKQAHLYAPPVQTGPEPVGGPHPHGRYGEQRSRKSVKTHRERSAS